MRAHGTGFAGSCKAWHLLAGPEQAIPTARASLAVAMARALLHGSGARGLLAVPTEKGHVPTQMVRNLLAVGFFRLLTTNDGRSHGAVV